MSLIEGISGNGPMDVDEDHRALTAAVTHTDMQTANDKGHAWCMPFDAVDPTAANDIFGYLQSTDSSMLLHVRRLRFSSSVAGKLEIIRVTGTPSGGSPVTLVNFNGQFTDETPTGVFESGVDITGLVEVGKVAFQELKNADQTYDIFIPHDVILGRNNALALSWVEDSGALTGTVWFYTEKPTNGS